MRKGLFALGLALGLLGTVLAGLAPGETLWLLLWLPVLAQVSIPNSFTAGTIIDPDQMNQNFDELGSKALNRTGGTVTGPLALQGNVTMSPDVTVDGVDLSDHFDGAGNITAPGNVTVGGEIVVTQSVATIRQGTNDGADTNVVRLCGGGAAISPATTRGSEIQLWGNESGLPGSIGLLTGNAAGSMVRVYKNDGVIAMSIDGTTGNATFVQPIVAQGHILRGGSPGADTGVLTISGGGGTGNSRGGQLTVYGNNAGGGVAGFVTVELGTAAGAEFRVWPGTGEKALLIDNTGLVSLPRGSLAFPATQNPNAAANVLDDYREGTWSVIDLSGAGLTMTPWSGTPTYVKIGRLVVATFTVRYPVTGSGANARLGGLPVPSSSSASSGSVILHICTRAGTGIGVDSGSTGFTPYNATSAGVLTNANMSDVLIFGTAIYLANQ